MSQRSLWKHIAESEDGWVFVAEDDIHLDSSCAELFVSEDWIPQDADIVKAETAFQKIRTSWMSRKVGRRWRAARLYTNHAGSAGYFIRRETASRLYTLTENYSEPTDETLFNPEMGISDKLRIYQLYPAICAQDMLLYGDGHTEGLASLVRPERRKKIDSVKQREKPRGMAYLKSKYLRLTTRRRTVPFVD